MVSLLLFFSRHVMIVVSIVFLFCVFFSLSLRYSNTVFSDMMKLGTEAAEIVEVEVVVVKVVE